MEFSISLEIGGAVLLIVAAVVFGAVAQFVGETRTGFEWLVDAVAFGIGGLAASEFITSWRTFEPVWNGLAIVPALIGGLVFGIVIELATRFSTGGTYTHHPTPA